MKIKHWQGYGTVSATKVRDRSCSLHVRVVGNHECGLYRNDMYDLFSWLVKRFDKSVPDYAAFHSRFPSVQIFEGSVQDENGKSVDTCDYLFNY